MLKPVANRPGVWYKVYEESCVLCGYARIERERKEGPKPDDPRERYDYLETACGDHFM